MLIQFFKFSIIGLTLVSVLLTSAGGAGVEPPEGGYVYALRYGIKKFLGEIYSVAYLDRIDLQTDTIVKSTSVDPGYNSLTLLDNNRLILCNTGGPISYGGADVFDVKQDKIIAGFKLNGVIAMVAIPAKDKIFIVTTKNTENQPGPFRAWTSIEIFDQRTLKKIKDIDLREGERLEESVALSRDKSKLCFIGWNSIAYYPEDRGLIGIINTTNGELIKQIDYKEHFGGGNWIAIDSAGKIYATAVYPNPLEGRKSEEKRIANDRLFIFDSENLSLIKTIPIGILAEQLTYVPVVNRLYIGHSSLDEKTPQYIEVLDCEKDKVIAKIPVKGFRRMAYVGNHKLYVSYSGGMLPMFSPTEESSGILVVDVRTNQVLKKIFGAYAPISYNFNPPD